ncbi:MAG: adenylyltransferase/cytidyltransferase family protein [Solibacillus sp.]
MQTILVNEHNVHIVKQQNTPVVMALGFFDGVHKGHQQVIGAAKRKAKLLGLPLAVMSFFPHPKTVFSNEAIDYLMPLEQKAKQLQALGVDMFYVVEFTKAFAKLSPKQFIEQYLIALGVKCAVAGFDYTFGAKGAGTIHELQALSDGRIAVEVVDKYSLHGEKVSSTAIQQLLKRGQVEEVTALLGKPHTVKYARDKGVLPYYTLPESGAYYVTIVAGKRAISQRIVIDGTHIQLGQDIIFEECAIMFHQRMEQLLPISS